MSKTTTQIKHIDRTDRTYRIGQIHYKYSYIRRLWSVLVPTNFSRDFRQEWNMISSVQVPRELKVLVENN